MAPCRVTVGDLFHFIRKAGNAASHDFTGDPATALSGLKNARTLAIWLHRTVTGDRAFAPGPFVPPPDPAARGAAVKAELDRLRRAVADQQTAAERAQALAQAEAEARLSAEDRAARAEALAQEVDADRARLEAQLAAVQAIAATRTPAAVQQVVEIAQDLGHGIDLDERETRRLIDRQLRDAGWQADSETLTFAAGVRPQKSRNLAIAEWPTANGPADYVLFAGLTVVGVVEAKRRNANVPAAVDQARRYAAGYVVRADEQLPAEGPCGDLPIPFLFASEGDSPF